MLDQLVPMWRQFRAEPWRLDILDEMIGRVEANQPSSLPDALQDALIREHLAICEASGSTPGCSPCW